MRRIVYIVIFLLTVNVTYCQSYETRDVIAKAESYLKKAVGEELFKYFSLGEHSDYEYKTKSGKSKWRDIRRGKRTKGIFVNANHINFVLSHPAFQYPNVRKTVYVELDSDLNLIGEIYLDQIPKFLLRNEPSDWKTESQIDEIIVKQNLKKAVDKVSKRLEFDTKSKEYYWIVFNTLYEEKCFADEEILHINAVSGIVFKHFEERQYEMHCY